MGTTHHMYVWCPWKPDGGIGTLVLELQMIVSCCVKLLLVKLRSSTRAMCALNHQTFSLAPTIHYLHKLYLTVDFYSNCLHSLLLVAKSK